VISRRLLLALVASLIVLSTAFATLALACALAGALQDRALAAALRWLATACLTLVAINTIVLIAALGLQAAFPGDSPAGRPRE
jgi:hypothetical protein